MKLYLETDKGERVEIKNIDSISVSTKNSADAPCEYCKTELSDKLLFAVDSNSQEWNLELMLDNFENLLAVELNTNWKKEYIEVPIKYCPFCGRNFKNNGGKIWI